MDVAHWRYKRTRLVNCLIRWYEEVWMIWIHMNYFRPNSKAWFTHILKSNKCLCIFWPYSGIVLQELRKLLYAFSLYGASQQGLCVSVDEEGWDGTQQRPHSQGAQTVVVRVTWDNAEERKWNKLLMHRIVSHWVLSSIQIRGQSS